MNYLAHLFLSAHNHELMIGNFIADSVKGNQYNNYSEGIKNGIIMHRTIDDFTDKHLLVRASKKYFVKDFDKYSGVLIDIYFDYFLAQKFSHYSSVPLKSFAANTYTMLNNNKHVFPEKSTYFFDYMIRENILLNYAEVEGIKKVLYGMTHRIKKRVLLYNSMESFQNNEEQLRSNFIIFFEELKTHLNKKKYFPESDF